MLSSKPYLPLDPLRVNILITQRMDETQCVQQRLQQAALSAEALARIKKTASELVTEVRKQRINKSNLDAFLFEYDLSSEEGVALLCLAEAVLRIPDAETVDKLIQDKLGTAHWEEHLGKSASLFVNAATWSLMLTGRIYAPDQDAKKFGHALKKFFERSSKPLIRKVVTQAVKILGEQFIVGKDINEALKKAEKNEKKGYLYSFDMLGEAARTAKDAKHYFDLYKNAILTLQKAVGQKSLYEAPGISVKLSALNPRYEFAQRERILSELIESLTQLALAAKNANISLIVDAEEADRLDLSLEIFAAVFNDPKLNGWKGLGLAVQAYQKCAVPVIDWVINLSQQQQRRIMVRLVKGAYWDYEIKDSQVKGLENYPVFTRKASTDVSYIACAKKMLAASNEIYPQFATHNAHTVATIMELVNDENDYEFQALHGMGHALYDSIIGKNNFRCRIYAPVGSYEDLLGYLVRRLLENGANISFVNRIGDEKLPIQELVAHPQQKLAQYKTIPHPQIPLPTDIFGKERKNSQGLDLANILVQMDLDEAMKLAAKKKWSAAPMIGKSKSHKGATKIIHNPANHQDMVGKYFEASQKDVEVALQRATDAAWRWDHTPITQRAEILERAADLFEQHMPELMMLAIREGGKSVFDAVGEVREAVDCCRYYAVEARHELTPKILTGYTGEYDELQMHGRGATACISPWNFPLAIFTGQITAALVVGNPVIAKPAKQTPLIAARAVELLHEAGIPDDVLQFLPGKGAIIGTDVVKDARIKMVVFTGSTEVGNFINQTLAQHEGAIGALIAETGGQNSMIVDSSAWPEQVVADAITSAFNSAGQRCSALRVLYLQQEIAEKTIRMLQGAMMELQLGDPALLTTDVGPVIDEDAKTKLQKHLNFLKRHGKLIYQVKLVSQHQQGTFFPPCAYEISSLKLLKGEIFGPILHVIRYRRENLDKVIEDINNTGYGLTQGIQSRIDETVQYIQQRSRVGNTYVNRNIIGAVIGVQPFGGEGLSGPGPKAGGPHYLPRMCIERTLTINTTASGGNASLMTLEE